MTDKNKEIIVKLVAEGKNSYADFRNAIPNLSDSEVIGITRNIARNANGTILLKISGDLDSKTLQPSDRFSLTEDGQNVLYSLQKESRTNAMNTQSLTYAKDAVLYARKAYKATVIIGAVTIALSVIMLCLALR